MCVRARTCAWTLGFNGKSTVCARGGPVEENHDDSVKYGSRSEQVFGGAGKAGRSGGVALMGD